VGKYVIRAVSSLERLAFLKPEGKVGYRYGHAAAAFWRSAFSARLVDSAVKNDLVIADGLT
jgi:hypothetical protein